MGRARGILVQPFMGDKMLNLLQVLVDSTSSDDGTSISILTAAITALIAGIAGIIGWFTGRRKK